MSVDLGSAYGQIVIGSDTKGIDQSAKALAGFDKEAGKTGSGLKALAKNGAAMGAAITTAAGVLSKAAKAAAANEVSVGRLRASIDATGKSWQQYAKEIQKAQDVGVKRGFQDEQTLDALSRIVQTTGNAAAAFRILATAQDLARARGMDLDMAAQLVARAYNGDTAALTRYGITLDKTATGMQAVAGIQQRVAGQADAYSKTTAGALDRISAKWGRIEVTAGAALGKISPMLQTAVALLPGLSIGFSGAGAAVGKLAAAFAGSGLAARLAGTRMATAGTEMAVAGTEAETAAGKMGLLRASLLGLAKLGVITVGVAIVVDEAQHLDPGSGTSTTEKVVGDILKGVAGGLDAIHGNPVSDWLTKNVDDQRLLERTAKTAKDLGLTFDDNFWSNFKDGHKLAVNELGLTLGDIMAEAKKTGQSVQDVILAEAKRKGITTDQIKALEAERQAQAAANAATQDGTDAIDGQTQSLAQQVEQLLAQQDAQDKLDAQVRQAKNTAFLQQAAGQGLSLPFTRDAEDAKKATEEFNQQVDELAQGAVYAAAGLQDISSELPGFQAGFGKAGDSVGQILLKMDALGALNLSPMAREALRAQTALDAVDKKLADVDAAIKQNEGDMSMWQGRIDLVDRTLGTAADGYAELNQLVAEGRLTQQEANDILQAGIWLRERSLGGLEDERAEQAKLIPVLAEYVKQHDAADGAVKTLTDDQRGFLAAMQDSKAQTALQTLQLLTYLAVMGQIPPEKVTQFIADASQADPIIGALFHDLGLYEGDHTTHLTVDGRPALSGIQQVQGALAKYGDDGTTITIYADTTDAAHKFQALNQEALKQHDVVVYVKGDDGQYQEVERHVAASTIPGKTVDVTANDQATPTIDQINTAQLQPKTVTISVTLAELNAAVNPWAAPAAGATLGIAAIQAQLDSLHAPPPIMISADDEVTPTLQAIAEGMAALVEQAADSAKGVSDAWDTGFANAGASAVAAIAGFQTAMNDAFQRIPEATRAWGEASGANFTASFAAALARGSQFIYDAAYAMALAVYNATKAALGIHSPSKAAQELAANYGGTFADVLLSQRRAVADAGSAYARAMTEAVQGGLDSPALRGLRGDLRSTTALAATVPLPAQAIGGPVTIHAPITVNGVSDPQQAADLVVSRLYRAFNRLDLAGVA